MKRPVYGIIHKYLYSTLWVLYIYKIYIYRVIQKDGLN